MVTYKVRSSIEKLTGILILTILSTIWISSHVSTVLGISTTSTPIQVKIVSPAKGQQVGIGNTVTLLGTSRYNGSSDCRVSIIVDDTRPYQNTTAIGQGTGNYSQWKYTLAPTYTALKEGINRVTAKLVCNTNPVFAKFYSINLTGVNKPMSSQQIGLKSNGPFFLPTSFSLASTMSNSTNAPSVLPVSVNSSSIIASSLTNSSSSTTPADSSGHTSHHTHHTNHSSSNSSDSSRVRHHSSSGTSHTHSESGNHGTSSGDVRSHSHNSGRTGHDFFHGAFSHFGGF